MSQKENRIQKALGTLPTHIIEIYGPRGGRIGLYRYRVKAISLEDAIYKLYHNMFPEAARTRMHKSHQLRFQGPWNSRGCNVLVFNSQGKVEINIPLAALLDSHGHLCRTVAEYKKNLNDK